MESVCSGQLGCDARTAHGKAERRTGAATSLTSVCFHIPPAFAAGSRRASRGSIPSTAGVISASLHRDAGSATHEAQRTTSRTAPTATACLFVPVCAPLLAGRPRLFGVGRALRGGTHSRRAGAWLREAAWHVRCTSVQADEATVLRAYAHHAPVDARATHARLSAETARERTGGSLRLSHVRTWEEGGADPRAARGARVA